MAKKKRVNPSKSAVSSAESAMAQPQTNLDIKVNVEFRQAAAKPLLSLPAEIGRGDWTAIILSLMIFFTPALGVPHEMMLQDTLKSIIVAFMSLGAALILFWRQRNRRDALRWHFVMWLPIMLCVYALGSMVWAHTYLAGVEAIRWFLFALIVWLVLNSFSRERLPMLVWGIHLGALAVALLGAAQFWLDVKFIPQGPNPAATFVNRNFAAEFVCTTLVFSAWLILRERRTAVLAFLAATTSFHFLYLMMCGTRSALIASYISFGFIVIFAWKFRSLLAYRSWDSGQRIVVPAAMLAVLLGLGFIPSGNSSPEFKGNTPFERVIKRTAAIQAADGTLGVRLVMWKASWTMIEARPLSGVGAGTWEADIPLYQAKGSQLETDYYVHNELIQVVAEYGIVGWLFLLGLTVYSIRSTVVAFRAKTEPELQEGMVRAMALTSLLALIVVSNIGFPWRLATTGVMFALCLGILAACDARQGMRTWMTAQRLPWAPAASQTAAVATVGCLALAGYISYKAAECEQKIVQSVKMALSISASGNPNSPKYDKMKREMLELARQGIAINPHYRKITPMLGDELAKWGDWKNAVWVWESVLSSRPYVAAIATNVARGYMAQNKVDKSFEFLEQAKLVQPDAVSVRSLEVILLSRTGKEAQALEIARKAYADKAMDYDMMNSAYILGVRASDFKFAIDALTFRNEAVPAQAVDGWMKIGGIYDQYLKDEVKAVEAYRKAYEAGGKSNNVLAQIPSAYHGRMALP
ncbi:O-antigen ligase family protein [Variovorax sp. PCZ-1]|uniref:O-antigen ligase family protein n=1 Tax=Variovorax sp. PCZ-1 TaxID=2835533 RepID=UPI001BCDB775|nr:O-antigen ligase family protein [Variovorax sp. PCZ-1]MBS7807507.1 O-antigen ligase family protein [Variovorax sp. PCZ-1]